MTAFDIHSIQEGERERAYVLVHLMKPDVSVDRWKDFLTQIEQAACTGQPRGVTVAAIGESCLIGLYTWEVQPHLEHGEAFCVDNFIAAAAFDPVPLFLAMMEDMEARARRLGCAAIQAALPHVCSGSKQQRFVVDSFIDAGFSAADQKLCKSLGGFHVQCASRESAPEEKSPDALH